MFMVILLPFIYVLSWQGFFDQFLKTEKLRTSISFILCDLINQCLYN